MKTSLTYPIKYKILKRKYTRFACLSNIYIRIYIFSGRNIAK